LKDLAAKLDVIQHKIDIKNENETLYFTAMGMIGEKGKQGK
jgi:hypothetical protein